MGHLCTNPRVRSRGRPHEVVEDALGSVQIILDARVIGKVLKNSDLQVAVEMALGYDLQHGRRKGSQEMDDQGAWSWVPPRGWTRAAWSQNFAAITRSAGQRLERLTHDRRVGGSIPFGGLNV